MNADPKALERLEAMAADYERLAGGALDDGSFEDDAKAARWAIARIAELEELIGEVEGGFTWNSSEVQCYWRIQQVMREYRARSLVTR